MRRKAAALVAALVALTALASWAAPPGRDAPPAAPAPSEEDARNRIVELAVSLEGAPYVYGSESPSGFDCSGFVHYVYASAAFINLPRNSRALFARGKPVAVAVAKRGDILVFGPPGGTPNHVAIYLGDGTMIHAASDGPHTGIIVSGLDDSYFGSRILGARSFIASSDADAKPSVAEIGCTVSSKPVVISDPIPAAVGSGLTFTITNGTGRDGTFLIAFCKADADSPKAVVLREDQAVLQAGSSSELPAFTFSESGVYRLIVKTADNTQLMQRIWKVIELKQ
jgi:hypothetical protein